MYKKINISKMTQKIKKLVEKKKIIEIIKNFPMLKVKTYAELLNMSIGAMYMAVWRLAKRKKLYFKGKNLKHGKIYVNNMLKKTN